MTKYPGKNPNLTDEQVEEWMLRVQGIHPEQIEEDRRMAEKAALRLSIFPYAVECGLGKILEDFPHNEKDRDESWYRKFHAWLEEQFGPEAKMWEFSYYQKQPYKGRWTSVSTDFWFMDEDKAKILADKYGGKDQWD